MKKFSLKKYKMFENKKYKTSPVFELLRSSNLIKTQTRIPTREELIICLMGKVGFSGHNIGKKTGFKINKVYRILKKANIKLWDFRHGKSQWGKSISNGCVDKVDKELGF